MNKEVNTDKPNIYQRISAVMQDISYLKKDAKVMSYKAITHDKVVSSVRSHLIKHGIVIQQDLVNSELLQGSKPIYCARYEISFVNIDSPSDRLVVHHEGHSLLTDDKSPGKTNSYALKNAILKTFMIETGESDEESNSIEGSYQKNLKKINFAQATVLKTHCDSLGNTEKFLAFYSIKDFCDLPESSYKQALTALENKINK